MRIPRIQGLTFSFIFFLFFWCGPWRITLTLVRKFQVEFIAALYLASNMHEAAFKPLQKKSRAKKVEKSV